MNSLEFNCERSICLKLIGFDMSDASSNKLGEISKNQQISKIRFTFQVLPRQLGTLLSCLRIVEAQVAWSATFVQHALDNSELFIKHLLSLGKRHTAAAIMLFDIILILGIGIPLDQVLFCQFICLRVRNLTLNFGLKLKFVRIRPMRLCKKVHLGFSLAEPFFFLINSFLLHFYSICD